MTGIRKTFARLLAALVVTGACLIAAAIASLYVPYQNSADEVFVTFERGAGTPAMARMLADAGVIRWPWEFMLLRARYPSATLQAGEYRFAGPAAAREVFARIARGDVDFFEFTVPEGSNMFDIAALLDASPVPSGAGVLSGADFVRAASDPAPVRDLAPSAPSQEGYLFPATYRLPHSITARGLCDLMTSQFRRQWKKLAEASASKPSAAPAPGAAPAPTPGLSGPATSTTAPSATAPPADDAATPPTLASVVTLASLVEKETSIAEERPIVAGVFANRIRKAMRLDCDPTTIYAALLDHRYQGAIHRSDLDSKNPYNTYQHDGLPPGPIANPGRDALAAALHPAPTEYLYFVAKPGGGGHQFSATLAAHEKAVRDYRHATQTQIAEKTSGKAR